VRAGGAIHVRRASPATIKELFIEEIRHYNPNMCDIRLTKSVKTPTNLSHLAFFSFSNSPSNWAQIAAAQAVARGMGGAF
jgi:hypothetical protein